MTRDDEIGPLRARWMLTSPPPDEALGELASIVEIQRNEDQPHLDADLEVVESRVFESREACVDHVRRSHVMGRLFLAESGDEELELMTSGLASPWDELCRADRRAPELVLRLDRLARRLLARRQAMGIDGLTGLRSRIALQRVLAGLAPSASVASPISLIFLDLDHFNSVNDEHGHQVGDDVLREFARHLARWARGVEVIARFGGEEFAVVARMPEDHAARVANHIRSEWAELDETIAYGVTVSCGIATASEPLRPDDLIARADMALYRAKASGRDRVMTPHDLEVDRSRAGEDAHLWDFETKIRVLTDRFAGRLAQLGAKATTRLREEVDRDSLTGLFSRRYLDRRLAREVEQTAARDRMLSVILIDLDDFRTVNRDYGYPGGEAALRGVGDSIRSHIRSTDWAARYGGEESCVVMPNASLDVAHDIAERLRGAIESASARAYGGREIRVTASLGIAELQPAGGSHAPDPVALIQAASDAVRAAKAGGKNRVSRGR